MIFHNINYDTLRANGLLEHVAKDLEIFIIHEHVFIHR